MSENSTYKIPGRPKTIFRAVHNKNNPFVTIDRRPVGNPELSYKAKGILTYILSRPDGWEVNVTDLVNHGKEGASAIRAGLKELKEHGHMRYNPARKDGKITKWVIEVHEKPIIIKRDPECEQLLDDDFLQVENLQVENRTQYNNDIKLNNDNEDNREVIDNFMRALPFDYLSKKDCEMWIKDAEQVNGTITFTLHKPQEAENETRWKDIDPVDYFEDRYRKVFDNAARGMGVKVEFR